MCLAAGPLSRHQKPFHVLPQTIAGFSMGRIKEDLPVPALHETDTLGRQSLQTQRQDGYPDPGPHVLGGRALVAQQPVAACA